MSITVNLARTRYSASRFSTDSSLRLSTAARRPGLQTLCSREEAESSQKGKCQRNRCECAKGRGGAGRACDHKPRAARQPAGPPFAPLRRRHLHPHLRVQLRCAAAWPDSTAPHCRSKLCTSAAHPIFFCRTSRRTVWCGTCCTGRLQWAWQTEARERPQQAKNPPQQRP